MWKNILIPLVLISGVFLFAPPPNAHSAVATKVLVRVVSKDAKVIGSGVGGASVQIVNAETGEILAQGEQTGGTGDTDAIMARPRPRGKPVYGTNGAAYFLAEIPLDRPLKVEIRVKAPLAFPHALQSGSKTVLLIPGVDIKGEGIIVELDGLIVDIVHPAAGTFETGKEVQVAADVRTL
jgi:hypothetical protein